MSTAFERMSAWERRWQEVADRLRADNATLWAHRPPRLEETRLIARKHQVPAQLVWNAAIALHNGRTLVTPPEPDAVPAPAPSIAPIGSSQLRRGQVACRWCDATFGGESGLAKHEVKKHRDRLPFLCEHCGQRSRSEDGLDQHVRKHHPNAPLPGAAEGPECPGCGKRCATAQGLASHRRNCATITDPAGDLPAPADAPPVPHGPAAGGDSAREAPHESPPEAPGAPVGTDVEEPTPSSSTVPAGANQPTAPPDHDPNLDPETAPDTTTAGGPDVAAPAMPAPESVQLGELLTMSLVDLLDHEDQAVAAAAEELVSTLERWQCRAHLYAERDALQARLAQVQARIDADHLADVDGEAA